MTLTPAQEEEVRKAWNEMHPNRSDTLESWGEWKTVDCKSRDDRDTFRNIHITAKGWDKEGKNAESIACKCGSEMRPQGMHVGYLCEKCGAQRDFSYENDRE